MPNCPLYNGKNLVFTGSENPYSLIQKAGKRRTHRKRSNKRRKTNKRRTYRNYRK